jgi:integrase
MKIALRKRKLSNGSQSLYLDIYDKGKRRYEYLNLVLVKPVNPLERQSNKETEKLAENIRAKRQLEIQNGIHGFVPEFKKHIDYLDYFESIVKKRKASGVDYSAWLSTLKHLKAFTGKNRITVGQVDEQWLEGVKEYLLNIASKSSGDKLTQNSAHHYFNRVLASLKFAFKEKLIADNPGERVGYIKQSETKREYLTAEELQRLAKTECRYPVLKRAFIFSALTGLRWSDVQKLTWAEVHHSMTSGWSIQFRQKKTDGLEFLPMNDQARELLGEKGAEEEKVFQGLKYSSYMNVELSRWVLKAGITKQITFHCGRHTNATLLLTSGADIYTVSKLLGHRELKTTQVYAKIIDQKKVDAVNRLPRISLC